MSKNKVFSDSKPGKSGPEGGKYMPKNSPRELFQGKTPLKWVRRRFDEKAPEKPL